MPGMEVRNADGHWIDVTEAMLSGGSAVTLPGGGTGPAPAGFDAWPLKIDETDPDDVVETKSKDGFDGSGDPIGDDVYERHTITSGSSVWTGNWEVPA